MSTQKMIAGCLLVVAVSAYAHNGHEHGATKTKAVVKETVTTTMTGEVLDLACYLGHDAKGKEHKKCAGSCLLEKHVSAGLLTAEGAVYLLVQDHNNEEAFEPVSKMAAEQVKVTGKKIVKGGLQAILVEKVEKVSGK